MAQWMGQYTGRTHESKIKYIEETLFVAIQSLRTADEASIAKKRKSVIKLCERLLTARLKAIRARISKISETRSFESDSKKTQNLVHREEQLREKGVAEIFKEYEIQDIVE